MSQSSIPPEILHLPIAERLQLVEQIWDSIAADQKEFSLTDAQKAELDRRIAAREAGAESGSSWDVVKQRLLNE